MQSISRTPSIYQIRHIESGKVYVGSAVNPAQRKRQHFHLLRNGKHHSSYLQHAWGKYGEEAFVFEIIEPVLFVEDLVTREQYWIDVLHATNDKYGYNTSPTAGSPLGVKHTDERNAANAARLKARYADPDTRAARVTQLRAQGADPAVRANMSKGQKKRFSTPVAREAHAARQKVLMNNPVTRAKIGAQSKARMEDPVTRANLSAKGKAQFADPDARAKQSERLKEYYKDPVHRQRLINQSHAIAEARRVEREIKNNGSAAADSCNTEGN